MSNKNLAIGFAVGLGIGAIFGLLYAPESGEEARRTIRGKTEVIAGAINKLMFRLRWIIMSPREKYLYLWNHGGSLREWREEYRITEPS